MNHIIKIVATVLLFVAIVIPGADADSAGNDAIDVVLVMDSSGSMLKTDPRFLRIPAAKLFISLLKKQDRAGVISFSDKGHTIIELTPADGQENKSKLLQAVDQITSDGRYTNLHNALRSGIEALSKDKTEGRTRIIVLMSDGMMDVGDRDEDITLVDKIRSELAVTLEKSGIKVYTIAFTVQSDRELLEKISKRTGGFYNLALADKDLHIIFTSIFESLKSPDMLPMSKNGFLIDTSVEEVTIVATKGSGETSIMLNTPEGRSYSYVRKSDNVEWFLSDRFDMITVKNPAEGRWEILFSSGENNKAYVITDLKLKTNFEKLYSTFGAPMDVKVWLEREGSIISEQDILHTIVFFMQLTNPEGNTTKLKPFNQGDGTYVRKVAAFSPGNYKLRIVAKGKTFEREKTFVFNVADVRESKEDVLHEREKKKKVEEQKQLEEAVKKEKAEEQILREEEETEKIVWSKILIRFGVINLILGLAVLAYFKINRRKKTKTFKAKMQKKAGNEGPQIDARAPEGKNEKEAAEEQPPAEQEKEETEEEQVSASEEPAIEKEPPQPDTTEALPAPEPESTKKTEEGPGHKEEESSENAKSKEREIAPDNKEPELKIEQEEPEPAAADQAAAQENADREAVLDQDDSASLPEAEPEIGPEQEEDTAPPPEINEQPQEIKEVVDINDILSDSLQGSSGTGRDASNNEIISQEDLDALLSGASETDDREEPITEKAEDTPADARMTDEDVDDMWAEAFKEAEGASGEEPAAAAPQETAADTAVTPADEESEEKAEIEKGIGEEPVDNKD